jgi:hypothetical protein
VLDDHLGEMGILVGGGRASRVLPTPPGPTKVRRWVVANAAFTSASNLRRPTKLVDSGGSLPATNPLAGDTTSV